MQISGYHKTHGVFAKGDPLKLTRRERECITLAGTGRSWKEVGATLCVSASTVGHHIVNARKKLDVHNTPDAIIEAVRRGEIPCPCCSRRTIELHEAEEELEAVRFKVRCAQAALRALMKGLE